MKHVGNLAEILGALFLAAIVVIVLAEVVARYLLQISISWPEELARYMAVWLTFIGAAAAASRGEQIVVDLLAPVVPAWGRRFLRILQAVLGFLAVGILLQAMMPLFGPAASTVSPGTGLELRWVYLALPVGCALIGLFLVGDLVMLIQGKPSERENVAQPQVPVSGD